MTISKDEIRDLLNQHKEHFRVLPTGCMNCLLGILAELDSESKPKEPAERVVGKRTRKATKKPQRSGR